MKVEPLRFYSHNNFNGVTSLMQLLQFFWIAFDVIEILLDLQFYGLHNTC